MKNRYHYVDEQYIAVSCRDFAEGNDDAFFIIDADSLHLLLEHDITWSNKKVSGGSVRMKSGISAKIPGGRSQVQLARLIMKCKEKTEKSYNLTGNPFDLRKCNLYKYDVSKQNTAEFKTKIKKLAQGVPPLPIVETKKKDTSVFAETKDIHVLTNQFTRKYVVYTGDNKLLEIDQGYAEELAKQLTDLVAINKSHVS